MSYDHMILYDSCDHDSYCIIKERTLEPSPNKRPVNKIGEGRHIQISFYFKLSYLFFFLIIAIIYL